MDEFGMNRWTRDKEISDERTDGCVDDWEMGEVMNALVDE